MATTTNNHSPCHAPRHGGRRQTLCPASRGGVAPPGWCCLKMLAAAIGIPERTLRNQIARLPGSAKRKVGGRWWIDARYYPGGTLALSGATKPKETPLDVRAWTDRSLRRDATIRRVVADADKHAATLRTTGIGLTVADKVFCARRGNGHYDLRFSPGTLRRWRKSIAAGESLSERRGRRRGSRRASIGADAWHFFKVLLLQPERQLSVIEAYRLTQGESLNHRGEAGWEWSSCYSNVLVRFKQECPEPFRKYNRMNPDAWAGKYLPALDRRPHDLPGNFLWEIDGTPANVMCRMGNRILRPQVVLVVDVGTGMILSVAVGISESAELIRKALWRSYQAYGACRSARYDMGKAFGSQGVSDRNERAKGDTASVVGFFSLLQVEVHETAGRNPRQKGTVESAMRIVAAHDRLHVGHIGNRPVSRLRRADHVVKKHPERLPTVDAYTRTLDDYCQAYNRQPRKDLGGLSPVQKFETTRIEIRRLPRQAEEFLRRRPQRVRVTKRGIPIRIAGEYVYYGCGNETIWQLQGTQVIALIDDEDASNVLVTSADGKPICFADNDGLVGADSEVLREAGKLKKKMRKLRKQYFDQLDFSVAPVADVAVQLKRKAAEAEAAKLGSKLEQRPITKTIIYPQHAAQMKEVQKQRALRQAAGGETAGDGNVGLTDLFGDAPVTPTNVAGPDIMDIDFGQEDHPVTDCFDDLLGGPTP